MFLPDIASFVSALLFAVHPIHTEAVSNLLIFRATWNLRTTRNTKIYRTSSFTKHFQIAFTPFQASLAQRGSLVSRPIVMFRKLIEFVAHFCRCTLCDI